VLAGPVVSASASLTDGSTANASWADVFGANGTPILEYYALIRTGGPDPVCTVTGVENGAPSVSPPGDSKVVPADAPSTSFGGLSANQTYTIWVFAYNGQGCTAAAPVQVTPRAVPGPVATFSAAIAPNGSTDEFYDYRVTGFTIGSGSTDADRFVYRFTAGAEGSASGVVPVGSFLTAGGTQYGNQVAVQIKACREYPEATLCSADWSPAVVLGVPVRNSEPTGLVHDADLLSGAWQWLEPPGPGAYTAVEYRCTPGASGDGWSPMGANGSCDTGVGGIGGSLRVRITANGETYERSYSPLDY
jgi:hypothetical protein